MSFFNTFLHIYAYAETYYGRPYLSVHLALRMSGLSATELFRTKFEGMILHESWDSAVLVLSQNNPSSPDYICRWFYRSTLTKFDFCLSQLILSFFFFANRFDSCFRFIIFCPLSAVSSSKTLNAYHPLMCTALLYNI